MNIRIVFLGDTLLGGEAEPTLLTHGHDYALAGLAPLLADADLVVANHEGPLTLRSDPAPKAANGRKRYWYRGRPAAAQALLKRGVRVVSLANNHTLDFGLDGLADTIEALDTVGIAHCGAGLDERQARSPAVVTIGSLRIGFVSYMQRYDIYVQERLYASGSRGGCARLRPRTAREDLAALEGVVDVRVALVHWGRNYRGVSSRQERLAGVLRAAGTDLVVGHHPHIVQRVDVHGGAPVMFSMGNGPLGTPGRFHSGRPPYGMIGVLELDDTGRITTIELGLIAVDNTHIAFRPRPAHSPQAAGILRSLVSSDHAWHETEHGLRLALPPRLKQASPTAAIRRDLPAGTRPTTHGR